MAIRPDQEVDFLTKLYEASIEGSLLTFNSLIQKDPLILSKISLTPFNETPLHITALLGHHDFTRQLLFHKPKLSSELDSRQRSPLHLASAEGHTEVVRVLLQENGDVNMCLAKDQDGKIPLHYAAMRGRIDVIKLLIGVRKESVLEVMPDGQTVLHLCVRYNHLEALKLLVELEVAYENCRFLNSKGSADGNTILHLAVMLKQVETVKYLLSIPGVKTGTENIVNHRGLKAFELLEHFPGTDLISDIIRHTFKDLGFENSTSAAITRDHNDVAHKKSTTKSSKGKARNWLGLLKYKGDWTEDKQGSIMIVSTVIATMTYQTAINPPGGIWQETVDDGKSDIYNCSKEDKCLAGTSILARYDTGVSYTTFLVCNSISFFASLSVILLLISGVHTKNKFFMFLLTLTMCVVVTALAFTYGQGIY
ncbi:hypothetical protein TIFTF001_029006 [Ficus carica]|uniref:PGG domain-containing protein n=1 Tax=Ficus carica TaxID=3494 RepID=A0AA88DRD1_FICCA|nr:hypothetical protein TIFTF001_029006 [Ficus carica]